MSGPRLIVGIVVMGVAVPLTIFFLLGLHTASELFTVGATTFLAWGTGDMLASILEKPRLQNRSPGMAIREDLERRRADEAAPTERP